MPTSVPTSTAAISAEITTPILGLAQSLRRALTVVVIILLMTMRSSLLQQPLARVRLVTERWWEINCGLQSHGPDRNPHSGRPVTVRRSAPSAQFNIQSIRRQQTVEYNCLRLPPDRLQYVRPMPLTNTMNRIAFAVVCIACAIAAVLILVLRLVDAFPARDFFATIVFVLVLLPVLAWLRLRSVGRSNQR